jgi:hypothetical protein
MLDARSSLRLDGSTAQRSIAGLCPLAGAADRGGSISSRAGEAEPRRCPLRPIWPTSPIEREGRWPNLISDTTIAQSLALRAMNAPLKRLWSRKGNDSPTTILRTENRGPEAPFWTPQTKRDANGNSLRKTDQKICWRRKIGRQKGRKEISGQEGT